MLFSNTSKVVRSGVCIVGFELLHVQYVCKHSPDPWEDLENRSPLRVPRNYPIVVIGYHNRGSNYFLNPVRGLGHCEQSWMLMLPSGDPALHVRGG